LIVLNNNEEALKYIKQALSIKYNKTLFKYLTELETRQRKLSDDMLFKKLHEQHLKNIESNHLNSSSKKISQDEKLNNSKDSSDSKDKQTKHSNFKEVSININNNKNNNNSEPTENNTKIESYNNADHNNVGNNDNKFYNKERNNFVKILNETSLNTNLISDNGNNLNNYNTINRAINNNNANEKNCNNNYTSFYTSSKILKITKILFMYLVQYFRKHKAIVVLLTLIFLFMRRKSIICFLRKILGY